MSLRPVMRRAAHAARRRPGLIGVNVAVAVALASVALPQVVGRGADDPLNGCNEPQGLVVAADSDVSMNYQRRRLIRDWNAFVDRWNERHPGDPRVKATMVELGPTIDLQHGQLTAAQESNSCAYDVLVLDGPWTAEFAERGFIEPVPGGEQWVKGRADIHEEVARTAMWNGRWYAVPWTTDVGLMYARTRDTQVPGTWKQLLDGGYATQLADYEGRTVNALEVIWNTSGSPMLSGPVESIDVPAARRLLGALGGLAERPAQAAGGRLLQASAGFDETVSAEAFAASRTGDDAGDPPDALRVDLMRNWPRVFRSLIADSRVSDDFSVAPLPAPSWTVLGGQNLAVSTRSRKKAQAGALIAFLTDANAEHRLFSCGGIPPTRTSVLRAPEPCQDPALKGDPDVPSPERQRELAVAIEGSLKRARPRPVTPYYGQFSETFRGCVGLVMTGEPPSAEGLADAINAALEGRQSTCVPKE